MVISGLDQSMDDACKLGSARAVGLAQQIGIERVRAHVTVELAAQSVLTHLHRDDWSRGGRQQSARRENRYSLRAGEGWAGGISRDD
jgi:hypothetical protein